MMNTQIKTQNLFNELKGNLFEYLTAQTLARRYGIEDRFQLTLSTRARQRLHSYEMILREHQSPLITTLPLWANLAANHLFDALQTQNGAQRLQQIYLVGKEWGGSNQVGLDECDILLEFSASNYKLIGLKLCKYGSYINTKNGGLRSFIDKYFAPFAQAAGAQQQLSSQMEELHTQTVAALFQLAQLPPPPPSPHWCEEWQAAGHSLLPGELPRPLRSRLLELYTALATELAQQLYLFYEQDAELFTECLAPLIGITHPDLLQLHCLTHAADSREVTITLTDRAHRLAPGTRPRWVRPVVTQSSFLIPLSQGQLQIRIKPMNRFDAPAFKVNCSVR